MEIATWNVNGIRSRHSEVVAWVAQRRPDVLCLQELKASPEQVPERLTTLSEYWSFWHGRRGGYSGVSLHLRRETFAKAPAFTHPAFDRETRVVQAELGDTLVASVYVPNGGKDYPAKLAFLAELAEYVAARQAEGRQVVLCGDLNVAHEERDVHPAQRDERQIGQRADERALFAALLASGLVDVGRRLLPDDERYFTWWPFWRNARARNLGWRLDYVLASPSVAERAVSTEVQREVGTSDHAPVVVTLHGDVAGVHAG